MVVFTEPIRKSGQLVDLPQGSMPSTKILARLDLSKVVL